MLPRGLVAMLHGLRGVTARSVAVVARLLMVSVVMMLRRLAMMPGGIFVRVGGHRVALGPFVGSMGRGRHCWLLHMMVRALGLDDVVRGDFVNVVALAEVTMQPALPPPSR